MDTERRIPSRTARDSRIQPAVDPLRSHTRAFDDGGLISRDGGIGCRRGVFRCRLHDLADIGLVVVILAVVVELGAWIGGAS